MRRWTALPVALVLVGLGSAVTPAAAATGTATVQCESGWGSLDKAGAARTDDYRSMTGIRTGTHPCFDRMVVDVPGSSPAAPVAYRIGYTDSPIGTTTDDRQIPVAGGKVLTVVIGAHTTDADWNPTYPMRTGERLPGLDFTGYPTFVEARGAGSHAGETRIGLGVRARLPYRVLQLDNRLVIDVAHTWGTTG
ncbi:hypothetical protein [Kitasatospora sp. DSM 101779]|uniref:AMIN-like domain-containing (lipo)protein n=1 Tax=Kitasatospora sp. DSM 101779 TaxID=2853165 RepID=UPI0021D7D32B|nr:hypothetical protein [Kitasatospora sp. DSM 101779]MCU7826922.1 hypothetical protein [Kitasatospora sp. DSM 101779]